MQEVYFRKNICYYCSSCYIFQWVSFLQNLRQNGREGSEENWFWLTKLVFYLSNDIVLSLRFKAILVYLDRVLEDPTPFSWTKSWNFQLVYLESKNSLWTLLVIYLHNTYWTEANINSLESAVPIADLAVNNLTNSYLLSRIWCCSRNFVSSWLERKPESFLLQWVRGQISYEITEGKSNVGTMV